MDDRVWLTAPYALRQHDRDFGHDWNPANKDSGNQKRHSMPRTHQKLGGPQREAATNCLSMDMGISWGCLFGPVAHAVTWLNQVGVVTVEGHIDRACNSDNHCYTEELVCTLWSGATQVPTVDMVLTWTS